MVVQHLLTIVVLISLSTMSLANAESPRNVLFIAADDLRCDLACYGYPAVKTPNLDRLAGRGVQFNRAYCQQALCNPSRSSLMTGRRPDHVQLWNLEKHFRDSLPDVVTLPQHFKNNGYFTQNIGKIYHNWVTKIQGDPDSWSVPAVMHFNNHGADKPMVDGDLPTNIADDQKCECRNVPDDAYFDGRIASLAVDALRQRNSADEPFFLAVGFWKPHSPFNAPKKYWDLYDRNSLPPLENATWPRDAPRIAWHNSREILGNQQRALTPAAIAEIRHGYLAAISYLDAQVGRVLDELESLGMAESTVVVFWSDHGYHLGEHTLWAKTSNFDLDAHVPLIIATPKLKSAGASAEALVELVDLYPTLVELCELPARNDLDGVSLVPVLEDPTKSVKTAAYTQHPRPAYYGNDMQAMGYSMRSNRYRYTEWRDAKNGKVLATELYDHDQDAIESRNLAGNPQRAKIIAKLADQMQRELFPGGE